VYTVGQLQEGPSLLSINPPCTSVGSVAPC
jgi:hypothetical protein